MAEGTGAPKPGWIAHPPAYDPDDYTGIQFFAVNLMAGEEQVGEAHGPTPAVAEERASLIVEAVNAHASLVAQIQRKDEALKAAYKDIATLIKRASHPQFECDATRGFERECDCGLYDIKQRAIAREKGESRG